MINRFEKIVLVILAGLGAGWWGIGLVLALTIPGEYNYYNERYKWVLWVIETGVPVGCFLMYNLAILKNRITRRRTAWPLLFALVAGTVLFTYLFETLFGTPTPSV